MQKPTSITTTVFLLLAIGIPVLAFSEDQKKASNVHKDVKSVQSRLPAPPVRESSGTAKSSGNIPLKPASTPQTHVSHDVPVPHEANHGADNRRMNPTHSPEVQRGIDDHFKSHGRK